jgi:hypothetical protein
MVNAATRPRRMAPCTAALGITSGATLSAANETIVHSGNGRLVPRMSQSSAPTMTSGV